MAAGLSVSRSLPVCSAEDSLFFRFLLLSSTVSVPPSLHIFSGYFVLRKKKLDKSFRKEKGLTGAADTVYGQARGFACRLLRRFVQEQRKPLPAFFYVRKPLRALYIQYLNQLQ
jgi:hypothetical protein